jgi:hypothetical protein
MRLGVETREIESHGIQSTKNYTIRATSKAFKILSSSLYKNKIKAIVRELGCNAYDAHISVGKKDLPFEIHLPNSLEPHFGVRDFGPGLDKDAIEEIYTTYFLSTKSESDDYIGALGLGSKSPFSYVDSYTTISRHNGIKSTYVAALDETGNPSLNLIHIQKSSEPSGLEVIVPVNQIDFSTFNLEANLIFRWFPVKPKSNLLIYPEMNANLSGTNWSVVDYNFSNQNCIVMGNIAYPLDKNQVSNKFIEKFSYYQQFHGNRKAFVIQANIGDVDITAGREELSYDKRTIEWLKNALDNIHKEYEKVAEDKIKNAASLKNAHQLYKEYIENCGGKDVFKTIFKYNDMVINSENEYVNFDDDFPDLEIQHYENRNGRKRKKYTFYTFKKVLINHYNTKSPAYTLSIDANLAVDNNEKGNIGKIYYRLQTKQTPISILRGNKETIDKFIKKYTGYDVGNVAEWDKKPTEKRNPTYKLQASVYYFTKERFLSTILDVSKPILYITEKSSVYHNVKVDDVTYRKDVFNEIVRHFFLDYQIIVKTKKIENELKTKLISFNDVLKDKIHEYYQKHDFFIYDLTNCDERNLELLSNSLLDVNHFAKKMSKTILKNKNQQNAYIEDAALLLKIENKKIISSKKETEEFLKKINGLYPLLGYIRQASSTQVKDYIEMCDKKGT